MADKTASYSVKVDTNAAQAGGEAADSLTKLKAAIDGGMGAVKDYNASLRQLVGKSEEVVAEKAKLKALVEAERGAISAASLALLKQGTSYSQLAEKAKKAEQEQKKFLEEANKAKALEDAKKESQGFGKILEALGGPFAKAGSGFSSLQEQAGSSVGKIALVAGAAAGAIGVIVTLATVAVKAATAFFDLSVAFAKWIVVSADAERSARIQREAWTGSEQGATALGHQIDALAAKVPTARDELQKMSGELIRDFSRSRVSGQGIVDTFNAVAVASAAMGDAVGSQLGELVKRSKDLGRMQVSPPDLRGTGIAFKDLALQVAIQMRTTVAGAEAALRAGAVPIDAGARALRDAVEKRFGEVNAKKLLSLDSIAQKLKESFSKLTSDVKLEPLLNGLKSIASMFDTSTVSGAALKQLITYVGNTLGPAFEEAAPVAKEALIRIEIGLYKIADALVLARNKIREAFAGTALANIDGAKVAMDLLGGAVDRVTRGIVAAVNAMALLAALAGRSLKVESLGTLNPQALGAGQSAGAKVGDGLAEGMTSTGPKVAVATSGLAAIVKETFAKEMDSHSPSRVMAKAGLDIGAGLTRGIDASEGAVQDATTRLAPKPANGNAAGPGAAPASIVVNVNIHAGGEGAGRAIANPSFLRDLTKAIEDALATAGIPTQSAVAA